jgi:CheY-like chemotaxis protein
MATEFLSGERLLIVEDDPAYAAFLTTLLAPDVEAVATAADGAAALRVIDEFSPTVVITDLRMPGVSGNELCERIRREPRHRRLPILVLSAAEEAHEVGELAALGLVWYLRKGADAVLLRKQLRNVVGAAARARASTGRWLLPAPSS